MCRINYELRDQYYKGTEYDLQKLVGKKLLSLSYKEAGEDKRRYKDVPSYEILLEWETCKMYSHVPMKQAIPSKINDYIGKKLVDWDAISNHACEKLILYFEDADSEVSVNAFLGIVWE